MKTNKNSIILTILAISITAILSVQNCAVAQQKTNNLTADDRGYVVNVGDQAPDNTSLKYCLKDGLWKGLFPGSTPTDGTQKTMNALMIQAWPWYIYHP